MGGDENAFVPMSTQLKHQHIVFLGFRCPTPCFVLLYVQLPQVPLKHGSPSQELSVLLPVYFRQRKKNSI